MKVLQINTTANMGSTGRIAEQIGLAVIKKGGESFIAYGVGNTTSQSSLIKISSKADYRRHRNLSKLTDMQGRFSTRATRDFVKKIEQIAPDIIHLHNLHGNYINYKVLFDYLHKANIPVVWTLHDCWPMTGHCTHFVCAKCEKWKTGCYDCPERKSYPKSILFDRSRKNYIEKREIFTSIKNLTIVPVSKWLGSIVKESFLKAYNVEVIYNGIDIKTFRPILNTDIKERYKIPNDKKIILGVATSWGKKKGFDDFLKLHTLLPQDRYQIVMIGLSQSHIKLLPHGIIGIHRTESIEELAKWYSVADVFANPTYEDSYPTTNLEAISCGTPVATYRTGGSPEALTPKTGCVVDVGDIKGLIEVITELCSKERNAIREHCREYAVEHFDRDKSFEKYTMIYKKINNSK